MVKQFFDAEINNDFFEEKHVPMDANKSTIEDHVLEQTSIKA
jgi:hypothetical protein